MRKNNFNILRLLAAFLVLFSHSFPLTGTTEPIGAFLGYTSGGGIAVDVFFVISGYLVTISGTQNNLFSFLLSRLLRVIPPLVVVVLFDIFVVGLNFTRLPLTEYFANNGTLKHLGNLSLFAFYPWLPGVFDGLPNDSVNGSLWTLPLEATMYAISAFFVIIRVRNFGILVSIAGAFGIGYYFSVHFFGLSWLNRGPDLLPSVSTFNFLNMGYFFFAGAALSKLPAVPSRYIHGAVAVLVLLGSSYLPNMYGYGVYFVVLPYLVYFFAFTPINLHHEVSIDISYGAYLYAFPIQQSIVKVLSPTIGPIYLTLLAIPITFFFACLSWKLIEKPSLKWKQKIRKSKQFVENARVTQ
ncbi:acyltransferase [Phyllobacterium sp. 628]|uniref:acyltransferase family protein n=1 Tax=Phyllobacterium sp. 628 TaxID=2718938 RepID=UPI0016628BA2|nr:acyltransferase [Phyllobacterium sp. 628]QND52311.1 acyltransferase [Phyllobacterium sp. 628]